MPKATTRTVRVSSQVSERLAALAHDTKRSEACLASTAIADFVEHNAWQVARITAALKNARSGRPGIPHEQIEAWMASWNTDKELPRPKPKR